MTVEHRHPASTSRAGLTNEGLDSHRWRAPKTKRHDLQAPLFDLDVHDFPAVGGAKGGERPRRRGNVGMVPSSPALSPAVVNRRGRPSLDPSGRSKGVHLTMSHQMFQDTRHRSLVNRLDSVQQQIREDILAAADRFGADPK